MKQTAHQIHEKFVDTIITDHAKKTKHLNIRDTNYLEGAGSELGKIGVTREEFALLIKDNIKELKLKYSDNLQDEVDFGNYDDFSRIFSSALIEFYEQIKIKFESFKAQKIHKTRKELRKRQQEEKERIR